MSLTVSDTSNYTPAPAGIHNAVCVHVVDLGVQQTVYGQKPKVLFVWELPEVLMDDGRPFTLSRRFTAGLSKKGALRPLLESWRGRPFTPQELKSFHLKNVLGKSCQLLVQHATAADGGRVYANVISVMPPAKGITLTPQAELLFYDFDNPDEGIKSRLPEWIVTLIDSAIPPQPAIETPYSADTDREFDDELTF